LQVWLASPKVGLTGSWARRTIPLGEGITELEGHMTDAQKQQEKQEKEPELKSPEQAVKDVEAWK
jgi:hypothetical protein